MSIFCCPVCKNEFISDQKTLRCKNSHSFDLSKSGYVNLLLSNQMNTNSPGDNKLMVNARRNFLNKGYYSELAFALADTVEKYSSKGFKILDAGCGEGYYTNIVYDKIDKNINIGGIDISKCAVESASKRKINVEFAVASIFHLPVMDNSLDMIFTLFAPFSREEFLRTLKKGGYLVMVIPDKKHLWELKQAIYDKPYMNSVADYKIEGFEFLEEKGISDNIFLDNNEDIKNLFSMTPYYYKTSVADSEKVSKLESLQTEIQFKILVYKKQ